MIYYIYATIIIILILIAYFCYLIFYKKNRKTKIYICNKIARLQYNRINNQDYLNDNPIRILANDILENSLTVIDKIV